LPFRSLCKDGGISDDHNKALHFRNREAWRKWLERNHDRKTEVWLLHYKKHSKRIGVRQREAVEVAICYGWIDGKLRSIDEERFALRYSPRRKGSVWSLINKMAALRMIDEGRMTEAGMRKIDEAKKNGMWASAYSSRQPPSMPKYLELAFAKNSAGWRRFRELPNSSQTSYIFWIESAKTAKTRAARVKAVVDGSILPHTGPP
jgi:uncharacterized protein YdeI (YjbR/CyaY-like superfamily)